MEIVRSLFEASNRGDIRIGADLIDEGVVFDTRGMDLEDEKDFARVYFGPGGVRAFWRAWLPASGPDMQVEVRWIQGSWRYRVIVWLHQQQVGRASGLPVEFDVAWDFLFRDGKIIDRVVLRPRGGPRSRGAVGAERSRRLLSLRDTARAMSQENVELVRADLRGVERGGHGCIS